MLAGLLLYCMPRTRLTVAVLPSGDSPILARQVSGLPKGFTPTAGLLTALRVHSDVAAASDLRMPQMDGTTLDTADVLNKVHAMTLASQSSNLWSIPTDCPQRERRGWMGDAQASCDEAMQNYDMMAFYVEFLNKIRDDQLRCAAPPPPPPPPGTPNAPWRFTEIRSCLLLVRGRWNQAARRGGCLVTTVTRTRTNRSPCGLFFPQCCGD